GAKPMSRPVTSEVLPERIEEHRAVQAWRQIQQDRFEPKNIQILKLKRKSSVYRLTGDAVARAVAGDPLILLADEPTGNLDSTNGEAVMELLRELHRGGATLCMVTHDARFSRYADRTVQLFDGRVVDA